MTKEIKVSKNERRFSNRVTLKELDEIETAAHHRANEESQIILRLAAALREAMQIEESALAIMSLAKDKKPDTACSKTTDMNAKPSCRPRRKGKSA